MNIQSAQRMHYFDALKAFTIFLVLCGHCIQYLAHRDFNNDIIFRFIYTFHMPLFMMMSGFFSLSAIKRDFWHSTITRTRMLLLPVVTLSLLLALIYMIVRQENIFEKFISLSGGTLWFLKTAFTCFIVTKLCYMCGKLKYIALIIMLIVSQTPIPIYSFTINIADMYPSFIIGLLIRNKWDYFQEHKKQIFYITFITFITMLLFFGKKSPFSILNKITHYIDVFTYIRCYRLITGLSGSVFFISLFCWLFNRKIENKIYDTICYFGQNTLGIYIFQFVYLEILLNGLIYFDNTNIFVFNFIIVPLISFAILLLCIATIEIIKKNKYSAFLFLGEKL